MPLTTTTAATAAIALTLAAALGLAACSDDRAGAPGAGDDGAGPTACLVTAARLGEILGTEQTVDEVDVPALDGESEGELRCETVVDDHDRKVTWTLASADMAVGGSLTHRELRAFVEGTGTQVSEVEVGADEPAWLGTSSDLGRSWATTATSQGERWLEVEVSGDDGSVTVGDASRAAVEVTRALVEAVAAGGPA